MRYNTIITAISAVALAEATTQPPANPGIKTELPDGYKLEQMIWRGTVENGGPEVSFNGTIEDVTRQIQGVKRDFTWDAYPQDIQARGNQLQERGSKTGIICNVGGESTYGPYTTNAQDSGNKLSELGGTCGVGSGPRVCAVLTCTRNAAVWLCNDNDHPIAPPCSSLASYVDDIVGACGKTYDHGSKYCRGQEFDSDGYNVIVGWKDHC
ncbi:hypothetical protein F4678DRAFT_465024 [Xylaria arbuscula]|nr:hypothetical protein F4678DRAFT_465024 [Xylaria arbuscula]